jgi:hypothetical protein
LKKVQATISENRKKDLGVETISTEVMLASADSHVSAIVEGNKKFGIIPAPVVIRTQVPRCEA